MLRRANSCIAISKYYAGWMRMFTDKPITTIHNGINISDFQGGSTLELPTDKLIAFFHGRLCGQKGIDIIVEAAKRRDDIVWILAGPMAGKEDGRCLEDGLLKDLKNLERQGKVILPGMQPQSYIGAYLRACDVAVYPHKRAPFDCAVLEAIACGAQVVTTGVDAIGEYANADNAFFCKTTAESLLEAIEDSRHVKKNGQAEIIKKYSWTNTALKTLEVYEGVIHGNEKNVRKQISEPRGASHGILLHQAGASGT